MRRAVPWLAAAIVLVALWPALCVSQEGGPTACRSAALLPLPWGGSADTWGWAAALGAGLLTFVVVRAWLRRRGDSR